MAVQRRQVMVSSENIANANTTRGPEGDGPYKPKVLVKEQTGSGLDNFRSRFTRSRLNLRQTRNEHLDEDYRDKVSGSGVPINRGPQDEVQQVERFRFEYDPEHPDADENGMVKYPDLDLVEEMTKIVSANRLYEANMAVVQAEKSVIKQSLQI